jgi:hypothetical protein
MVFIARKWPPISLFRLYDRSAEFNIAFRNLVILFGFGGVLLTGIFLNIPFERLLALATIPAVVLSFVVLARLRKLGAPRKIGIVMMDAISCWLAAVSIVSGGYEILQYETLRGLSNVISGLFCFTVFIRFCRVGLKPVSRATRT